MVKWQDINELAKEVFFFKKRSRSRTIWIRGGLLGSFTSLLFYLSLLTGITIESNGDIYGCGSTCEVYVNITSTYYRIGLESFPIYFDKNNTKYEVFVPARGRGNWRPIKLGYDFIERKNKYNVLPNRFKIIIHKNPWETIKYGVKVGLEDLDPYIFSENIHQVGDKIVKELCEPVYKTWSDKIWHYKNCTTKAIYSLGNDSTTKVYNYTCLDYIEIVENKNVQVDCIKIGKVNVSGKVYSPKGYFCKLIENEVCCASNIDGGEYASWYRKDIDSSVDIQCDNLITDKITVYDKTKRSILI